MRLPNLLVYALALAPFFAFILLCLYDAAVSPFQLVEITSLLMPCDE